MIARPARGPNSDKGPAQAHDASRNSQHDHPLSCHRRPVAPDALDFLGLSPLRSKLATIARTQILTEAFVIGRADPNAWISYSRAKMFYTSRAGASLLADDLQLPDDRANHRPIECEGSSGSWLAIPVQGIARAA